MKKILFLLFAVIMCLSSCQNNEENKLQATLTTADKKIASYHFDGNLEFIPSSTYYSDGNTIYGRSSGDSANSFLKELSNSAAFAVTDANGNIKSSELLESGFLLKRYEAGEAVKEYTFHITDDNQSLHKTENGQVGVTKNSDGMYTFSFSNNNGSTSELTFEKKPWGMWNIHSLYLDGEQIAGGGSDWEYVLRFNTNYPMNAWDFFGGSHGKEALCSFDIYDINSGALLVPDTGKTLYADGILISEKSYLHFADSDEALCLITREYSLRGGKIYLDVSYSFEKDSHLYLSYTCMLPIPAGIAHSADVYYDNGTIESIDLTKTLTASSETDIYSGYSSRTVSFNCKTPNGKKFSLLTEVYTVKDSTDNFNSDFKTAVYNMKESGIKLYFGKYDEFKKISVPEGTTWNTSCSWCITN